MLGFLKIKSKNEHSRRDYMNTPIIKLIDTMPSIVLNKENCDRLSEIYSDYEPVSIIILVFKESVVLSLSIGKFIFYILDDKRVIYRTNKVA